MKKLNNNNLKLAIQKEGRLTEETIEFLKRSGLIFETSKRQLFSVCRNFPLEILFVRIVDIPKYVSSGIVDIGILGQNFLYEERPQVKKLLNLKFGFCSLVIAAPKESTIRSISNLKNKTIATSYPNSVKKFFQKNGMDVETVTINGSVEITPALGIATAIADLVSTGSTLALNDLREVETIYNSEAVLISSKSIDSPKQKILQKLITRFKGVLSADSYKYIMMNAPEEILPKLKKVIPGLKSPTIAPLGRTGWLSVQSVVKEDVFWETIERLKLIGATGIIVLPIEKMMI